MWGCIPSRAKCSRTHRQRHCRRWLTEQEKSSWVSSCVRRDQVCFSPISQLPSLFFWEFLNFIITNFFTKNVPKISSSNKRAVRRRPGLDGIRHWSNEGLVSHSRRRCHWTRHVVWLRVVVLSRVTGHRVSNSALLLRNHAFLQVENGWFKGKPK